MEIIGIKICIVIIIAAVMVCIQLREIAKAISNLDKEARKEP